MGTDKKLNCHEIAFYYLMKPKGTAELNSNSVTQLVKETLHRIPIEKLREVKAYPTFLKEFVEKMTENIIHIVSDERKT